MKVQIFFKIQISLTVPELVVKQINYIKQNHIRVVRKDIICEHTRRIGIILGVNIQYGSRKWHQQNLQELVKLPHRIIELKTEQVYKK